MSKPLPDEFIGTWRFANEKEIDGWNYLHFSKGTERSRIVQFFNIKDGEFNDGRMLVSPAEENDRIQFYPQDGSEGWTRGYRFDDGNLVIVEGDDEYPCTKLSDLPDWLNQGIQEASAFFDKEESNWGTAS